jgi:hypothetical protein
MHADQKNADAAINLNKIEIDFEFPTAKSKNNSKSKIKSEIKNIFNFNSNAGKSNKELYLVSRLYATIFAQKENIYGNLFESIINLILQIQNEDAFTIQKIKLLRNYIA